MRIDKTKIKRTGKLIVQTSNITRIKIRPMLSERKQVDERTSPVMRSLHASCVKTALTTAGNYEGRYAANALLTELVT